MRFVVLACSYKHGGRCVAGVNPKTKEMIRLISYDYLSQGAIPKEWCFYSLEGWNRALIKPLDLLEIEIGPKAPIEGAQYENYYVKEGFIKEYIGEVSDINFLESLLNNDDYGYYPFGSKYPSISTNVYATKNYSLCVIRARNISGTYVENNLGNSKEKVKFDITKPNGEVVTLENYSFTDANKNYYATDFFVEEAYLVISLPSYDSKTKYHHKFVSALIKIT